MGSFMSELTNSNLPLQIKNIFYMLYPSLVSMLSLGTLYFWLMQASLNIFYSYIPLNNANFFKYSAFDCKYVIGITLLKNR